MQRDPQRFSAAMRHVTDAVGGLAYGGDYNPEQWPKHVWDEDVALMQEAGVQLVSLGIFSWSLLEPREGEYEFGWLDEIIEKLHAGGIRVDLADATASPPAWLGLAHPESLPVTEDGVRLTWGSRQAYCPTSTQYRQAALRLTRALADRYGEHPAVVMWHINNEYGCHNIPCYCDSCAANFRAWLGKKYGTIDELNDAWGTAFWSQRYGDWAEVMPPRASTTFRNPAQRLDWARATSDAVLDCYLPQAEVLRATGKPVTTNFMGTNMSVHAPIDYFAWADEQDIVSNDHYLVAADPDNAQDLAFTAALTSGWALGAPWLLMEHSTSAVNWQPRNVAKAPGEMLRNSMQHVARGADGVLFFQWRQSRSGAEKFHSAMVPHAGRDSKIWREVVELGATLRQLREVAGSTPVQAQVVMLVDTDSRWAAELEVLPSEDARPVPEWHRWFNAFWRAGIPVDLRDSHDDLTGYDLVVAPLLHLTDAESVANITAASKRGADVVVTYFSGIVNERNAVILGDGYPGAFADFLGVRMEEFSPLRDGASIDVDGAPIGTIWSEFGRATTAEVVHEFTSGAAAGSPAVTRRSVGDAHRWYVATSFTPAALDKLVHAIAAGAGVTPEAGAGGGVEVLRRERDGTQWAFCINHGTTDARIPVRGLELRSGDTVADSLMLPAGGVAIVRLS